MTNKIQRVEEEKDFAEQMEALAAEAQRTGVSKIKSADGFQEMLRPMVMGIIALSKAAADNSKKLEQLQESVDAQSSLSNQISSVQGELNREGLVTQKLFDALHEELRGYKDNFLLEVLQKPIIRDLIMLFDDMSEMHRRLDLFMKENEKCRTCVESEPQMNNFMHNFGKSLDNTVSLVVEVLARLDVNRLEPSIGKFEKEKHRVVAVTEAASPEENDEIIQSIKPGFIWRNRMIRPEEVIIKKWSGNL